MVIFDRYGLQPCAVTSQVIYGAVSDTLLFLQNITDISKVIRQGTSFFIADDSKIVYSVDADSFNYTLALISEDTKSIDIICFKRLLKINADKCTLVP